MASNLAVIDGEHVDLATGEVFETVHSTGSLAPIQQPPTVAEIVERLATPEALRHQQRLMAAYDQACNALIGPNDVQVEGDRVFKKKSAWRKLGRAFAVSTEIRHAERWWEFDGDEGLRHYIARVVVRTATRHRTSCAATGAAASFGPVSGIRRVQARSRSRASANFWHSPASTPTSGSKDRKSVV